MDSDKQGLAPSAPGPYPADADTFYPPMENPPPYAPMYPDPSKIHTQHQHVNMTMPQAQAGFPIPTHMPHQPPGQTIIQIVNAPLPDFGPRSVSITCPHCAASIQTSIRTRYTTFTHIMAGVLCLMCCCCFSWAPYFCDCFNEVDHTCPNCDKYLGAYSPQRYNRRRYY